MLATKSEQLLLREKMLEPAAALFEDIPTTNSWSDIFDLAVTKRSAPWQLYGSRKPDHEAYAVTQHIKVTRAHGAWRLRSGELPVVTCAEDLAKLSIHNTTYPRFEPSKESESAIEAAAKPGARRTAAAVTGFRPKQLDINHITSHEALNALLDEFVLDEGLDPVLAETHKFTMCLPAAYYGPGSYTNWVNVGMALENTADVLFLSWVKLSAQEGCRMSLRDSRGHFDWSEVQAMHEKWATM